MEEKVSRTETLLAPSSILPSWLEQPMGAKSTTTQGTPNHQDLPFYQPGRVEKVEEVEGEMVLQCDFKNMVEK